MYLRISHISENIETVQELRRKIPERVFSAVERNETFLFLMKPFTEGLWLIESFRYYKEFLFIFYSNNHCIR